VEKALGMDAGEIPEPLPAWNEVETVVPGLMDRIVEAVERDNA